MLFASKDITKYFSKNFKVLNKKKLNLNIILHFNNPIYLVKYKTVFLYH